MKTNVQKWGNSLGIRLPRTLVDKKALANGSTVKLTETKTGILIEAVMPEPNTLEILVHKITHTNRHEECEWPEAVGKELW